MTDLNALKRAAAAKALEYVVDGMKLGLGSGSTAEMFVEMLAPRVRGGQKLLCVPTSERTAEKARKLGITMASLDDLAPLDLTVDGADEADRNLDLIKGGGGMLLREKIVAASSKKMIVIADETKMVPRLGKFPLPVEVVEFGHKAIAARLVNLASDEAVTRFAQLEVVMCQWRRIESLLAETGPSIYFATRTSLRKARLPR